MRVFLFCRRRRPRRCFGVYSGAREIYLEGSSMAQFAIYPDIALALLHDCVNCRKAETGSFTRFFGGKERFENLGSRFLIHADSRVCPRQHLVLSWLHLKGATVEMLVIQVHPVCLNGQSAAFWHGVACIHDQIDRKSVV